MSTASSSSHTFALRKSAHAFCQSLLSPPAPAELISQHFSSKPRITEHGPPWATSRLPFLGKTFEGKEGCEEYFSVLSETLKMEMSEDTFPGLEGFIVDAEAHGSEGIGVVSVVGKARFSSIKTGKGWDEQFIYRLSDFDNDGKIGHWEIWADPLSAWQSVGP